ncbi:MAG TPA: hypothetical protein DCY13_12130 [Verrucomicrobiales bacterium]|nr:hypothetical protein [Verrucomicrobiales bacterium]
MPSEADKPIEKQLREHAARRRAEAGPDAFALHPVTRNVLQVEVEREYGGRRKSATLFPWWPRLIWAGGALAVVALLAVVMMPPGDAGREEMAKAEPAAEQQPLPVADDPIERRSKSTPAAAEAVELAATAPAPPAREAKELELKFSSQQPAALSKPVPSRETGADEIRLSAPSESGRANSRVARAFPVQPDPGRVLPAPFQGEFVVTLVDDVITIVDSDSSRYQGRVVAIDPVAAGAAVPSPLVGPGGVPVDTSDPTFPDRYHQYSVKARDGSVQQLPLAAQFTVTGTNSRSQLPVIFSARMLTQTLPVAATTAPIATPPAAPPSYLQIKGTVILGEDLSFTVDASTAPQ